MLHGWQQQAEQNADNGNDNQQFNDGEAVTHVAATTGIPAMIVHRMVTILEVIEHESGES